MSRTWLKHEQVIGVGLGGAFNGRPSLTISIWLPKPILWSRVGASEFRSQVLPSGDTLHSGSSRSFGNIVHQCHNPCCHWLSPTHFPCYFHWMKQSRASAATLVVATHSVLRIVIQVGIRAPSVHKVHFQFTPHIYYPVCTYYSSL